MPCKTTACKATHREGLGVSWLWSALARCHSMGKAMSKQHLVILVLAALVSACNSGGVVEIGPNQYMLGGVGAVDFSGSAVKARFYQQASEYCASKGLVMQATGSTAQDQQPGSFASAEIQFTCIK